MDRDVKQLCKVCQGSQVTSRYDPPEVMSHVLPRCAFWHNCSADLLGPLPTGESITVVGDHLIRCVEVVVVKSIIKSRVFEEIFPIFA